MTEIRKLLRFNKNSYGVTIPNKYRKQLRFNFGDYAEISLDKQYRLIILKHEIPKK